MPEIQQLLDIMRSLRDPDTGCPWDRQQTFQTIAPYTLEEAYEVVEAIESDNMDNLRSELGDLLLQVVYHAQIAEESQLFNFNDVVSQLNRKLIDRHPHVFGDQNIETAEQQSEHWESVKVKERRTEKVNSQQLSSILDGIGINLPALYRAQKLQARAARVGFDWNDKEAVFAKIDEELTEFHEALNNNEDKARLTEELGDILFVCVNLARHMGIDAETALRNTNKKFQDRFYYIETRLAEQHKKPEDVTLNELDQLWEEAKQNLS